MNSPLTVIDPTAPRRRNPIAIGANRDELGYGWGADHNYWKRGAIANVFVALGEGGRGYRHASQPRNRNNGEKRIAHDISLQAGNSKVTAPASTATNNANLNRGGRAVAGGSVAGAL
jgi:hypothetical protein